MRLTLLFELACALRVLGRNELALAQRAPSTPGRARQKQGRHPRVMPKRRVELQAGHDGDEGGDPPPAPVSAAGEERVHGGEQRHAEGQPSERHRGEYGSRRR